MEVTLAALQINFVFSIPNVFGSVFIDFNLSPFISFISKITVFIKNCMAKKRRV